PRSPGLARADQQGRADPDAGDRQDPGSGLGADRERPEPAGDAGHRLREARDLRGDVRQARDLALDVLEVHQAASTGSTETTRPRQPTLNWTMPGAFA